MKNQKKKVLLVITKSNFGGAQKYVYELAKNLQNKGDDVVVVVGGTGVLINKLEESQIKTISIPYLGRDVSIINDIKTFIKLFQIIRREKPHIVHLNSSKIGGIGALVSRIAFVPKIIFTIHGWAFNEDRGIISKFLIKISYLITLILTTRSIAVSNITKKQAQLIPLSFLIYNKIEVVHNGIEVPNFLSKKDSIDFLSSHLNTNLTDKIIIGQIAELHPIKSIGTTIDAASKIVAMHPNTVFIIIGDGQEKTRLQKRITDLNLNNNVYLTGFINNAAQYLTAFDLFCLTSKSEALALVLIEAGLARVPVIASNVGGIPELISHNESGFLFESGNTQQLIELIEKFISMPETNKNKLILNFLEKINRGFLIEHMAQKTRNLY